MKWTLSVLLLTTPLFAADRPNFLWITSEDNGPHLGCYGDTYATTPNLDALAAKGLRYTRAWSNAPVCAPARTTVISGLYPPSTGSEHMRSQTTLPEGMKLFPAYLREAGYYCTNAAKEDYNLVKTDDVWDESSGKAHWRNRTEGQPFFAVFNSTLSHESQIRNAIPEENRIHDPAKVRVPAYHPDTPEVRKDWAQYYDRLTMMDAQLGGRLREIEEAGLADDTIIFYWGDHGSGMPRNKRWPYHSGLHVPLIVHVPEKWKALAPDDYAVGGTSDRLVSFVDLAPTMLSLAGIEPEKWMQGIAFAGQFEKPGRDFNYGFRGRMDERIDLVRSVTDGRFVYLRQYLPHRIYGQYIDYMFQTPTTRVWRGLFDEGKLNQDQSHFWEEKPAEELYDLLNDRDEVVNLVEAPEYAEVLAKLRGAHESWEHQIRDIGFLPEEEIHARAAGSTPYEVARGSAKYDFDAVFTASRLASSRKVADLPVIVALLGSPDSGVRYWGATGLLIHGQAGFEAGAAALREALGDDCGSVAIVAAESLGRFGTEADREKALDLLLARADQEKGNVFEAILALNALDYLDEAAAPRMEAIRQLPRKPGKPAPRVDGYAGSLLKHLTGEKGSPAE
ncbi:MAG: sulfatase-like hydrolase/transferase [Verrucomicrobiales bacterium]|nr:sulfatase-like hydrolase/transferase [Verrucomicrobiales bacterium]